MPRYKGGRQYGQPKPEPIEPSVQTVLPEAAKSTDFKVKEVLKMVRNMKPDKIKDFIQGDTRKTVKNLT